MASPRTSSAVQRGGRADPERAEAPAVSLVNVTRVFGSAPGVVRVDLEVARGEALLVRGPNGAGKSTLLRLIATAISPTYGSGSVLGFDLVRGRTDIRRRIELVGHRTRLYEDLTGLENLRFVCTLYGIESARSAGALEWAGLTEAAGDPVRTYSQGMRQRLALCRAVLRTPELMLLDEPYAGLDAEAKALVDDLITDAAAAGRTVILATHDQARGAVATRSVRMEGGRLMGGSS